MGSRDMPLVQSPMKRHVPDPDVLVAHLAR